MKQLMEWNLFHPCKVFLVKRGSSQFRGMYITPHPLTVESQIMTLPQTASFQQTQLGWNKAQHSHQKARGLFGERNIGLMGFSCQVLLLENS